MSHFNTIRTIAMSAGAALLLSATGYAAGTGAAPTAVIRYDAASAKTDRGARELYQHIVQAAAAVCPQATMGDLQSASIVKQCREDAVARAMTTVHEQKVVEIAGARAHRG